MRRVRRAPGRRAARRVSLAAVIAGLVVAAALVWQSSYAVFSDSTSALNSTWQTGSVALADNDSGVALFSATNLFPGSTGSRCIRVSSTGTVPATVRLYGTGLSTTKSLSSHLNLQIVAGTGAANDCGDFSPLGGPSVYTGTLADFTATTHAAGYGSWSLTGTTGETRTFKITYTLSTATPNEAQGASATVGLVWEARTAG